MEKIQEVLFIVFIFALCVCNCFHSMPIACNVSLNDYCPASLYFVPTKPISIEETAALFRVNAGSINKTVDGFAILVNCSCPAEHDWFVWRTDYTIEWGDTWESISLKFGSFVVKKPEKPLFTAQTVTLDLLCGCSKGLQVVTYEVVTGDTLFTICSRFRADLNETEQLNRLPNPSLIHSGDVVFIPTSDSEVSKTSKNRSHVYLEILLSIVAVILVLSVFIFLVHRKRKKREQSEPSAGLECSSCFTFLSSSIGCSSLLGLYSSSKESGDSVISAFSSEKSTVFQYYEVLDATSNFSASLKIGQGSYGSVYLGKLRGTDVAIKQMKNTKSKEFLAELNILCKVHHTNLIELIGYASGGDSLFLVYEFAQNGALSDHLHNPAMRGYKSLPWTTRVGIALDAAKGLEYIHMHTKPYYVHRDVKTSNILLDSNFRAKLLLHLWNLGI
ncbi:lysM domain-containing protein [Cinnamomum micranthum f. kanehirae]|uniref:LysM domain-containing protein n=1 Tax=Cinnamomum micranthum f. kanehirae TaxID=337451 RepID=A0A443N499_9MAGN|nr:lysM domain-containing protein [Cinnamomum micranthum f. kanehirae]